MLSVENPREILLVVHGIEAVAVDEELALEDRHRKTGSADFRVYMGISETWTLATKRPAGSLYSSHHFLRAIASVSPLIRAIISRIAPLCRLCRRVNYGDICVDDMQVIAPG